MRQNSTYVHSQSPYCPPSTPVPRMDSLRLRPIVPAAAYASIEAPPLPPRRYLLSNHRSASSVSNEMILSIATSFPGVPSSAAATDFLLR